MSTTLPQTQTPEDRIERIATATGFPEAEVEVLKRTIVPNNVTNVELSYFLMVAKQQELNPFNKEIWCIKGNDNRLMIMTGRDGFLRKAQRDPRYRGIVSAAVRENDDFELDLPAGTIKHKVSKSQKERGELIGAYCLVRLANVDGQPQAPHIEWAPWEVFNRGGNGPWKSHPDLMIQKVAESHALKKAFGFAGLDIAEDYIERGGRATPTSPAPGTERPLRLTPAEMTQAKDEIGRGVVTADEIAERIQNLVPEQLEELRTITVKAEPA